ncbi:hypothetical protein [Candidatus Korobacter versatilis]|nr:hypothetical protein [Candidatus Koribacter versatilis]
MATAVYFNPVRTQFDWHRRIVDSLGLHFVATASVTETLHFMEEKFVSLVLLSNSGGYGLEDAAFPIKARHTDTKVVVLASNQAPDRLPDHVDAWICVADHEDIVRERLRAFAGSEVAVS